MQYRDRPEAPSFIRRLMPEASEAELRDAAANFDAYMALVMEIVDRRRNAAGESTDRDRCDRVDRIPPGL